MSFVFVLGDDGDGLPSVPPLEVLDTVAGYEILSFDSGTVNYFIKTFKTVLRLHSDHANLPQEKLVAANLLMIFHKRLSQAILFRICLSSV